MNKIKKLYRDFFGLREQAAPPTAAKTSIPGTDPKQLDQLNIEVLDKIQNTQRKKIAIF